MGTPVVHFEIIGKDADILNDFYSGIFGWEIDANNPMKYGIVESQGRGISGGISASDNEAQRHVTFYIQVDDIQKYLDDIESKGGEMVVPVTEIPNMVTFAMFNDPEGNLIGLIKEEQT